MASEPSKKKSSPKRFTELSVPEKLFNIIKKSAGIIFADSFSTSKENFISDEIKEFTEFPGTGKGSYDDIVVGHYLASHTQNQRIRDLIATLSDDDTDQKQKKKDIIKKYIKDYITTIYVIGVAQLLKIYYEKNVDRTNYKIMFDFFNSLLNDPTYKDILRYKFTGDSKIPESYKGRLLMEVFFRLCFIKAESVNQQVLYFVKNLNTSRTLPDNIFEYDIEWSVKKIFTNDSISNENIDRIVESLIDQSENNA
jgi:hypothetical protein